MIVILQHKPAPQEAHRLIDDGLPGNRPLLAVDLALVVNIERTSHRQRDELIRKGRAIHLEHSLPCLDKFVRCIGVTSPRLRISRLGHLCSNRCRSVRGDHLKGRILSVPVAQQLQECEPTIQLDRIPRHGKAENFVFVRSILDRELFRLRALQSPCGRKEESRTGPRLRQR